jgi:hypothetical protein
MEVRFRKEGRVCRWTALRPPRTRVPGPSMAAGASVPHDLATFAIEQALQIDHGFWGCVADGATFRTLGRKRTPQGRAVIHRHVTELDDAERRVNVVYAAWRAGSMTPANGALDGALAAWKRLPDGGELVCEWRRATRRAGRTSRRADR